MEASIICAIISSLAAVTVAVISAVTGSRVKRSEKKEKRRQQESILSLQMMSANMELAMACCNALCGGHNNGNVEAARKKAIKAAEEYDKFEKQILAEEIA